MSEKPIVLVTGASGFIATHIVQQLLKSEKYKVRGSVRSLQNEEKIAPLNNLCPGAVCPLELVEAELCDEKSWVQAVKGCTYVIHVASPCPLEDPEDEDVLIKPAVEGTINVLKACRDSGSVKRVVLTSAAAAVLGGWAEAGKYSEDNWADTTKPMSPYPKSKTLAEKAAWSFLSELPEEKKFELSVIIPNYAIGPVLCGSFTASQEIPKRILERLMPALPKLYFHTIDVRDVARAHVNAMTVQQAAGKRHLLFSGGGWLKDFGVILDKEFKQHGYNAITREAPSFVIKLRAIFDSSVRMILPGLDKSCKLDSDRMSKILGITDPISLKQSLVDMAYSMIEGGKIKKTKGYKGPPSRNY